jgi:hypothetical protein
MSLEVIGGMSLEVIGAPLCTWASMLAPLDAAQSAFRFSLFAFLFNWAGRVNAHVRFLPATLMFTISGFRGLGIQG